MTLQQQAYRLIDSLPDDSVQIVIQLMQKMNHAGAHPADEKVIRESVTTPKMRAYLRMQELRRETANYDISDSQRAAAMDEKFGIIGEGADSIESTH